MPDVRIGKDGFVVREAAGLSIGPRVEALPPHLVPKRLSNRYPGACGSNELSIWQLDRAQFTNGPYNADVEILVDPRNREHGFVRPARKMTLVEFQGALGGTVNEWMIYAA